MKTLLSSRRTRGFTYLSVVVTMIVVGLMLAAYLKLVSVQNQLVVRSETWNRTVPIIEAGVEEAMAHINKNASGLALITGTPVNMTADGWAGNNASGWSKFGWVGNDYYIVHIAPWAQGQAPIVTSTGYVWQLQSFALNPSYGPLVANIGDLLNNLSSQGRFSRRAVLCTTTNLPLWYPPFATRRGINLNGNNVTIDSFDSQIAGRNIGGRWHSSIRRDNGDLGSNDTVTNAVNLGNGNVYGKVRTGPFGVPQLGPNASVGDKAWVSANTKGIKPGWHKDDMNMEFPDVVPPNAVWSAMPAGGNVGGTSYNYVFSTPGYYRATSQVGGKILVTASNVFLKVDAGWRFSGQDRLQISSNANIVIYLDCTSADITGQGVVNFGHAAQCYIFGTSKLTSMDIGGNGEMTAAVYAPYANISLRGGGSSDEDFSGGIIGNSFTFVGHYHLHADEALMRIGLNSGYAITSWNEP